MTCHFGDMPNPGYCVGCSTGGRGKYHHESLGAGLCIFNAELAAAMAILIRLNYILSPRIDLFECQGLCIDETDCCCPELQSELSFNHTHSSQHIQTMQPDAKHTLTSILHILQPPNSYISRGNLRTIPTYQQLSTLDRRNTRRF